MSYSFKVRDATKTGILAKLKEELNTMVRANPQHAFDRHQVENAAGKFVAALEHDAMRDILIVASGSVFSTHDGTQDVSMNLQVSLVRRES